MPCDRRVFCVLARVVAQVMELAKRLKIQPVARRAVVLRVVVQVSDGQNDLDRLAPWLAWIDQLNAARLSGILAM
jgi:hypothetical protein